MTNSTTEAARADQYSGASGIRLFTVGQGTPQANGTTPADHLLTGEQPWSVNQSTTISDYPVIPHISFSELLPHCANFRVNRGHAVRRLGNMFNGA